MFFFKNIGKFVLQHIEHICGNFTPGSFSTFVDSQPWAGRDDSAVEVDAIKLVAAQLVLQTLVIVVVVVVVVVAAIGRASVLLVLFSRSSNITTTTSTTTSSKSCTTTLARE